MSYKVGTVDINAFYELNIVVGNAKNKILRGTVKQSIYTICARFIHIFVFMTTSKRFSLHQLFSVNNV